MYGRSNALKSGAFAEQMLRSSEELEFHSVPGVRKVLNGAIDGDPAMIG